MPVSLWLAVRGAGMSNEYLLPEDELFRLYHRGTLTEPPHQPSTRARRALERQADDLLNQGPLPKVKGAARDKAKRLRAASRKRYGFITRDPSTDADHYGGQIESDRSDFDVDRAEYVGGELEDQGHTRGDPQRGEQPTDTADYRDAQMGSDQDAPRPRLPADWRVPDKYVPGRWEYRATPAEQAANWANVKVFIGGLRYSDLEARIVTAEGNVSQIAEHYGMTEDAVRNALKKAAMKASGKRPAHGWSWRWGAPEPTQSDPRTGIGISRVRFWTERPWGLRESFGTISSLCVEPPTQGGPG